MLISFGGLDSFKDELWFMTGHGAVQRGIAVLMVDGPGQGGTLRRHKIASRHDYEVPVGKCIDWLEQRADVDASRIAVSGSSMGGYYAARAGSREPRLAACISHGAIWDIEQRFRDRGEDHALANHMKWVLGAKTMTEAIEKAKPFKLEGCNRASSKKQIPTLFLFLSRFSAVADSSSNPVAPICFQAPRRRPGGNTQLSSPAKV